MNFGFLNPLQFFEIDLIRSTSFERGRIVRRSERRKERGTKWDKDLNFGPELISSERLVGGE